MWIGRLWRSSLGRLPGALSEPSLVLRRVSLHVAEECVSGLGGSHGEVDILGLKDGGVRRPASRVADVVEGDLDCVGCR